MFRTMCVAVAFMSACVVVQANQCSSGSECQGHREAKYAVSLLQSKMQINVPVQQYDASKEGSKEAQASAAKEDTNEVDESVRGMAKTLAYFNKTVRIDSSVSKRTCDFGSTEYALFIDGKDNGGKYAYGHDFIDRMEEAWTVAQETLGNEITAKYLLRLHKLSRTWQTETPWRDGKLSCPAHCMFELPCLASADEKLKEELLLDLPQNIVDVVRDGHGSIGTIFVKQNFSQNEVYKHITEIIGQYNKDQREAQDAQQKLTYLAKFLRSLAWLHPFDDGNGRLRNLVLQREIRRLQLGCGAMMYNNNADIYFESPTVYANKIIEGIAAARHALKHGHSPWRDATWRDAHLLAFPVHSSLERCRQAFLKEDKDISFLER